MSVQRYYPGREHSEGVGGLEVGGQRGVGLGLGWGGRAVLEWQGPLFSSGDCFMLLHAVLLMTSVFLH